MNTAWHDALPHIGDFINKVGFPVASWLMSFWIFYKFAFSAGSKIWSKLEPFIASHFDLVKKAGDNICAQTDILIKTNNLIEKQNQILDSHSKKLDEIGSNQVRHMADHGIIPMKAVGSGSNGIKR